MLFCRTAIYLSGGMKRTILIADDARFMCTQIREIVEAADYEVVAVVGDAAEAVAAYKSHEPDCVTMDVIMPGNGITAIEQIVAHDPDARILVVTAVGQRDLVDQAITAGAAEALHKPILAKQLVAKLDQLFRSD